MSRINSQGARQELTLLRRTGYMEKMFSKNNAVISIFLIKLGIRRNRRLYAEPGIATGPAVKWLPDRLTDWAILVVERRLE